jgi:hypothetical protein
LGLAKLIVARMTSNAYFPSPTPTLAVVTSNLDALEAAETVAKTRAKGAAAARNLKLKASIADCFGLRAYVQSIADANEDQAEAIIESAGMNARKRPSRSKADLAASMGPVPGQVILRAKAGKNTAYEWQLSSDGGKTWVTIALTNGAKTAVPGLTAGTTYQFRCRRTVRDTTSDWSQVVSLFVH